jgi:hypothetical protein
MDAPGNTFADEVVEAIGAIHSMAHMAPMAACLIGEHTPLADGDITDDLPDSLRRPRCNELE